MKKFYSLALIFIALFSCVVFSACGDKYADLKIEVYSSEGYVVDELRHIIDDTNKGKTQRLLVNISGVDKDDVGQIVVYSIPNELITVTNYTYNESKVYVDFIANMASDPEAKMIISHLDSGKKAQIDLHIEQKSNGLNLINKDYLIEIPQTGEKKETIDFTKLLNLTPYGSTDEIYFEVVSNSRVPSGVSLIKFQEEEELEDLCNGLIVGSNVQENATLKIYPVTYLEGYSMDNPKKYTGQIITLHFKHTLNKFNTVVDSNINVDLNNIQLIANDNNLNSIKLGLKYLRFDGKDQTAVPIISPSFDFMNMYDIELVSENPGLVSAFIDSNNDIIVTAHAYTNKPIELKIILNPINYVGLIEPVEFKVFIKGELKSDGINVLKNGEEVDLENSIDIFNYYEEGNSLGSLFTFEATSSLGVVNSDLSQMRILINPSILSLENIKDVADEARVNSTLYSLEFYFYDRAVGNKVETLKFEYDDGLQKMVSTRLISKGSRLYIKYIKGGGSVEFADFGITIETCNLSKLEYWTGLPSTSINLNFNRVEGVKAMTVEAGWFEYKEDLKKFENEYLDCVNGCIYLNRAEGLDNQNQEIFPKFINVKNGSVLGIDDQSVARTVLTVTVESLNNATNMLKIHNGRSQKDLPDGTINTEGSLEFGYNYDADSTDDIISLVFRRNTDIGRYRIVFSQEGVVKGSVICLVYEELEQLSEDMITVETNKKAFRNDKFQNIYESDYIVSSKQDLNISIELPNEVILSDVVTGYEFGYVIGVKDKDGSVVEIPYDKTEYFNTKHDDPTFNNAVLNFVSGTHIDNVPQYVYLTITVFTKTYQDIVTENVDKNPAYDYPAFTISFFIYEEITRDIVSINHTNITRYYKEYLSVYNQDLSSAELKVEMQEDLWDYVTTKDDIRWEIDNDDCVNIAEDKALHTYSLNFLANRSYETYTTVVKAYIQQFETIFEFQCVFMVEKPILTERIFVESEIKIEEEDSVPYVNLKKGEVYEVKASNYSSKGNVTNQGIVIQVADKNGSAYNSSTFVDVDQTTSTITVKEVAGAKDLKLIIFAKDVLGEVVSSGKSGYNNPLLFLMDLPGTEEKAIQKAFFVVDLILSDGSEDNPYLIENANDFWEIDDTEAYRKSHYLVMSNISLDNTVDKNEKTVSNLEGTIKTYNDNVYTFDGVYLNETCLNVFRNFKGSISNIKFVVDYRYNIVDNSDIQKTYYLGVFDANNGELLNISVELTGNVHLDGTAIYYFGGLAGENRKKIEYNSATANVVGVDGLINLNGTGKVFFGGLVGRNISQVIGSEIATTGGANSIIISGQEGRSNSMSLIEIESNISGDSAIGGVVGLNTYYDDKGDDTKDTIGTIHNAFVQAVINAESTSNVGGVIGKNQQIISPIEIGYGGGYISGIDIDVLDSTYTNKAIYNVKSASIIVANNNVGGIVGLDENGVYVECDYQVLSTDSTNAAITANSNVGGIAGKSQYGKFSYCSVMSYKWDYLKIKSDVQAVINTNVADIYGQNNVGGIVGSSGKQRKFDGFNGGNISESVIISYSSVNAYLKSENSIGGILTSEEGNPILFSAYFIGKLDGSVVLDKIGLSLSNNDNLIYNLVYSFNVSDGKHSSSFNGESFSCNNQNFASKIADEFWWWNENINGGYIFITNGNDDKLPIFDLAPTSIEAVVKDETETGLTRVLKLDYYDFSVDAALTEEKVLDLKQRYNIKNILDLITITAQPSNLGTVVVNVRSTNTMILDVTFDGRIIINGVGECDLIFSSALNPNAGAIENRTIRVIIDYPIGNQFSLRNNVGIVGKTENIAKDTTKQYYVVTNGSEAGALPGQTYSYRTKTNVYLNVEVSFETTDINFDISEYISVSGKTGAHSYSAGRKVLTFELDDKTPFMISAFKKLEDGKFKVKVSPYRIITNAQGQNFIDDYDYEVKGLFDEFDLLTLVGVSGVSFSYDEAIVYPNDTIYLTMTLATDKALCANPDGTINISKLRELFDDLIKNGKTPTSRMQDFLFEVVKLTDEIRFNVSCENSTFDEYKLIQLITLRIEFEDFKLTKEEKLKFNIYIKSLSGSYKEETDLKYTIIPQRINKIEIKNYYYDNEGIRQQEDVLKPNHFGEMIIDIVPNNGYYDHLEISDITGDEEILFIQVDSDGFEANPISLTFDPSSDGKGIKLYGYKDKSRIYVRTQISNEYSSKIHTIQVRAYSAENKLLASFNKEIDVKMLPEIKATYLLPNGKDSNQIASNGKNFSKNITVYLANGVDAHLRIETKNSESELEYMISGDIAANYEFVHDVDNFYILRSKTWDVANIGEEIKLTLSTYNNDLDYAECSITFKIVEFVIHSVSVTGSVNNEISGYFGKHVNLEFYFDKYDVSFYDTSTLSDNFVWDTVYEYNADTPDQFKSILEKLNLKNGSSTNDFLILNNNTKNSGVYNVVTSDKINLTGNVLRVDDGYDEEKINEEIIPSPKYLAVAFKVYYESDVWDITTYQANQTADISYIVDQNYKLNFIEATKWYEPTVINNIDDFLSMTSGGNYILNADLTKANKTDVYKDGQSLKNYVPLNVDLVQFDGNGHTIEIESFGSFDDASIRAGLFAQVYENMIVKNVKVKYLSEFNSTFGWPLGHVDKNNNAITYADLCNNPTVRYTDAKFGGITAVNEGVITNCVVEGQVALHASTLETSALGGEYVIDFDIGGLVAENTSKGYITNSNTELNIFSQSNIGGFVHKNSGKIVSCGVDNNTTIYAYNINLGNTIIVEVAGFVVENSGEISMSYVDLKQGEKAFNTIHRGTMSSKDISAGFAYSNSGSIYDTYVKMTSIGVNNNIFTGFVYSNSGTIERAFTYLNGGVKHDNNDSMFAPAGTTSLKDCAEVVLNKSGYSNGIEKGLSIIDVAEVYKKSKYEELSLAFGDNKNAVWSMVGSNTPTLVSTIEMKFSNFLPAQIRSTTELIDGVETTVYDFSLMFANYGSKENPYIVHDLETWNNYFNETLAGRTSYYRIVKDIDFVSVGGNPSTSVNTFSGNIQGNNMVLSNIMLYSNERLNGIGLFESLEGISSKIIDNAVRNLTLNASSVWASSTSMTGVLAGSIKDFNIYNIKIDAEGVIMVGGNAVGGLAGVVYGEFDIDSISSNIGSSSTRASTMSNYSAYLSKNNKKTELYNIKDVYYAGSVAGILDGYGHSFDLEANRYLNKNYYKVKNVSVSGSVTVSGDTVGGAFGLVGEKVKVEKLNVNISNSVFGSEYSAGAVGENRGVITDANIVLGDDIFRKSKNVSSGAIGFNLGGLIRKVDVEAKIIKSEHLHTVAGVVGRNIAGTITDVCFDGELFGFHTGGIVGANYNKTILSKRTTGSGALSPQCADNKNLIPSEDVQYYDETSNKIDNFKNLSLGRVSLEYLVENSSKYYSYRVNKEDNTLPGITTEVRVLGLVVGLAYNAQIVEKNTAKYKINLTDEKILFNSAETISVQYQEKNDVVLKEGTDEVKYNFGDVNVLTLSSGKNYVMYLVGAIATSFDSWTEYSNEYLLVQ